MPGHYGKGGRMPANKKRTGRNAPPRNDKIKAVDKKKMLAKLKIKKK